MKPFVYADNAATTKLSEAAFSEIKKYMTEEFGNPSGIYSLGRRARRGILEASETIARAINASPEEIYFTSGGTESDNWAIRATVQRKPGGHIITSNIEHHAVSKTLEDLTQNGYSVTYLPVDKFGRVSADNLIAAIKDDTALITIMSASNEVGTILPTASFGEIARSRGIPFHTDAVQAVGHIPVDVREMKADMLSLSGHKFHGPKGVGALYVSKEFALPTFITGGGQERGLRSGTENVPGICGMAAALKEATVNMDRNITYVTAMRDRLITGMLSFPGVILTGDPVNRLPGIASFALEGIDGEALVYALDREGICVSSGSACSSGASESPAVLKSLGLVGGGGGVDGAIRISLDGYNTQDDIDLILRTLPNVLNKLRGHL